MWRAAVVLAVSFVTGCSGRDEGLVQPDDGSVKNHPLSEVKKDDRPPFRLDPTQPYRIEFGRGSGRDGLNTVKVSHDGRVTLHRVRYFREEQVLEHRWEASACNLTPAQLEKLLRSVEANGLLDMHRAYHAKIADGTQWVLWIQQGPNQKSVYFNNHFPRQILRFASQLDGVLSEAGEDKLEWQTVSPEEAWQHDRELWDSLRSK
jgi:hypothetical protein